MTQIGRTGLTDSSHPRPASFIRQDAEWRHNMENLTMMDGFRFALGGIGASLLLIAGVSIVLIAFASMFGDE